MVRFYCGISETIWNYHPVSPGKYACVSPIVGNKEGKTKENRVYVPEYAKVIQDSGAFSDSLYKRLSFAEALERQIRHGIKYEYSNQITHRASYDILIDEVWTDGNRSKQRWSVLDAEYAVEQTVLAAKYIKSMNDRPSIISAQGVDAKQYLQCTERVVEYIDKKDIFGMGGWCILGKQRKVMMPVFEETLKLVVPFLSKKGVGWIHIWGVIFPAGLGKLLWICDQYNIHVSTDSAGPNYKPALGSWGYGDWRIKDYQRPPTNIRGQERARHVQETIERLKNLRSTQYYKEF